MKKISILLFALFAAKMLFAQFNSIDTSMYSPALGMEKMVDILLPPGYYDNPDEHYPVIYFLHGAGGNQNSYSWIYSFTYTMINSGSVHPFILVKPNGNCPPYMGSSYTNSILYGNYEDYIVYDLVAWIDSTYRTIPERQFRCITGHSMGGGGSASLAFDHSDVYHGFAGHAGLMNFDTTMAIWIPEILQENIPGPPYSYTYGAGIYTDLMYTGAGAYSPNLNNDSISVDLPLDENGARIDSVWAKWQPFDNCCRVKQISASDELGIFFSVGINDELGIFPSNLVFRDTLDMLGLDYEFLITQGDHTLTTEMMQAGYEFLDSLMWIEVGTPDHTSPGLVSNLSLSVNPNPIIDRATLQIDLKKAETLEVRVFNPTGREILAWAVPSGTGRHFEQEFSLSGYEPGIYFIRVRSSQEVITKKIIKVR